MAEDKAKAVAKAKAKRKRKGVNPLSRPKPKKLKTEKSVASDKSSEKKKKEKLAKITEHSTGTSSSQSEKSAASMSRDVEHGNGVVAPAVAKPSMTAPSPSLSTKKAKRKRLETAETSRESSPLQTAPVVSSSSRDIKLRHRLAEEEISSLGQRKKEVDTKAGTSVNKSGSKTEIRNGSLPRSSERMALMSGEIAAWQRTEAAVEKEAPDASMQPSTKKKRTRSRRQKRSE